MAIAEGLLPEFDIEASNTRKILERVPEDKFDWKPHEKSMSMIQLASHLANILTWTKYTINQDSLDIAPVGAPPFTLEPAKSRQELLDTFDQNRVAARVAIAGAADEHLLKPWALLAGGNTMFTMPRIAVLRTSVMNHSIHHRAQLGVFLRLNNVPLPALYGPSADEGM